ncbi:MAG TPA: hypothetical protein VE890_15135, partial [Thermoguttaceae bacterium]|nr:hypothetical protein [Thermoguttaceae bacterium]
YAGDTNPFSMFSRHGVPKKTFYAMRAFRLLLNTPVRVATSGSHPGQSAVCAGVDQERNCVTVLVANYRADDTQFDVIVDAVPWKSSTAWKTWRVDATRDLEPSETGKAPPGVWRQTYRVPTPGLLVIQLHGET